MEIEYGEIPITYFSFWHCFSVINLNKFLIAQTLTSAADNEKLSQQLLRYK